MKLFLKGLALALLCTACNSGSKDVDQGMYFYSIGNYAKAKFHLLKAEGKSLSFYSEKEYYTILGNTFNQLSKLDSAKIYHLKALKIDPNYSEALVNLGVTHRQSGDFEKALKCYNKANQINPNNAQLHTSLGSLYLHMNQPETASEHLQKAISIDKNFTLARSNYALALAHLGDLEQSEQELKFAEALGYQNGYIIRQRIRDINPQTN